MKFKTLLTLLIFNGLGCLFAQENVGQTPASPDFLVPYRVKNLWGFSDQQGNIKIKPVYSAVGKISYYWTDGKEFKSLMEVVKENHRFVINHLNETVVPPEKEFDSFSFDSYSYETIIATKKGKKALYYDGKELLSCAYDDIERIQNLSFKMRTGNLVGLVNSTGKVIIPQKFYFVYAQKIEDENVTWGASNDLKGKKESFTEINLRDTVPNTHDLGSVSLNSTLSLITSGGYLNLDSTIKALSAFYQDAKPDGNYSFLIHISKNGKKGLYNAITKKLNVKSTLTLQIKRNLTNIIDRWLIKSPKSTYMVPEFPLPRTVYRCLVG